jgi:GTPase
LHPHVGVCNFGDLNTLTVADIPGLIEGASEDRGLGHEFLRHVERTKCLCYVIDASGANKDPAGDLTSLIRELSLYDPLLPTRPAIVVANKMDLRGGAVGAAKLRSATQLPVLPVSALTRDGVGSVVEALRFLLDGVRKKERAALLEREDEERESRKQPRSHFKM